MMIGTFRRNHAIDSFFGTITTLVGTVPVDVFPFSRFDIGGASDDSLVRPDYTVLVHGIEVGLGWTRSVNGPTIVALTIDSPVLAAAFTCTLQPDETGKIYQLDWERDRDGSA